MSVLPSIAEPNPLRQAIPRARVPEPCTVVLFGATGDLVHRKLVPALYHLDQGGHLPGECAIVGFARRDWSDQLFRDELKKSLVNPKDPELRSLLGGVRPADLRTTPATSTSRPAIRSSRTHSNRLDATHGTRGNRLFYLAVSPRILLGDRRTARPGRPDLRGRRRPVEPGRHREAVRPRPRQRPGAEPRRLAVSARTRSTGSTTTWARRRSRTSWPSASATRCSSRSGTATTSSRSRSPPPRNSGWPAAEGGITTSRAPSAT